MERRNDSRMVDFLIVGFSDFPGVQIPLLLCFLCVYIVTLSGNFLLITLICWSPSLTTPMYSFLCNLSSLDIVYTSVTCPKLISIFTTNDGRISFLQCIIQLYFFIAFASTEYFLLTVMSYDRYVAICKPLHYTFIMSQKMCILEATCCWLGGIIASIPIAAVTTTLDFCSSNVIDHFFCDITALINLACGNTTVIQTVILIQGLVLVMTSFILTLISYIHIVSSIMKIRTAMGKYKTFSTCASHLSIVTFFYITVFVLYMRPSSAVSLSQGKALTISYMYIIPMMNPVVYSFRNQNVKVALRQFFRSLLRSIFPKLSIANLY